MVSRMAAGLILVVLFAGDAAAQPGVDSLGDPLPPGAVAPAWRFRRTAKRWPRGNPPRAICVYGM